MKVRAKEYIEAIKQLRTAKIVLIGHSYGCATVLQAYHMLESSLKSKITHIVLLDPWLFPLESDVFDSKLEVPTCTLAN